MPSGCRNTRSVSTQIPMQRVTKAPDPSTPGLRLTQALGPHSKCNEGT